MTKKDKYIILYLAVLLVLGIIHWNFPSNYWLSVLIPISILYVIWDIYFNPLKYTITPKYLLNELAINTVKIKCYHNNDIPTLIYCKVNNGKIMDGYREIPSCIAFNSTQSLQFVKDTYSSILNVHDLHVFLENNKFLYKNRFNNWLIDAKNLSSQSLVLMAIIDIIIVFIHQIHNSSEFRYLFY